MSLSFCPPSERYVVWRVADLSRFPNAAAVYKRDRRRTEVNGEFSSWQETVCSGCGEPVWHQPENAVGRRVVCWPCAGEVAA